MSRYKVALSPKLSVVLTIDRDVYEALKKLSDQNEPALSKMANEVLVLGLAVKACESPYDFAAKYHVLHDKLI